MTDQPVDIVRANQGDTLDAVVWRYYGQTVGYVETVMAANPGIAGLGIILPLGTEVKLPVSITVEAENEAGLVRLWD